MISGAGVWLTSRAFKAGSCSGSGAVFGVSQEFGSTDLDGKPFDVSKRDPSGKQPAAEQSAALDKTNARH